MPTELRRELATQVLPQVASPLADKVAHTFIGPWARPLATATKARQLADPTIVVGGARRVVSGGATPRQLVYGAQWGGGARVATVTRHGKPVKVHTTRQFAGRGPATVFATIRAEAAWVLDQFAGIVDRVLAGVRDG